MRISDWSSDVCSSDLARIVASTPGARFIAGGTNLLDLMKLQIETPAHLVDINGLDFDKIEYTPDCCLRICALVRNIVFASHMRVLRYYPLLSLPLLSVSSFHLLNTSSTSFFLLLLSLFPFFFFSYPPFFFLFPF